MMKTMKVFGHVLVVICVLLIANTVFAAGGVVNSPTGTAPDRYVYYPEPKS